MSAQNPTIPTATQAKGIESVILDLQTHLDFDLVWLTNGMGRAYRLTKVRANQSVVFIPEVYLGTNQFKYFAATPDNDKKGQSIFIVGNEGYPNQQLGFYGLLEYEVSIIFAVNLKLIDPTLLETDYFEEHQIEDVRESLIRNLLGKAYKLEVNEVVRQFEDVYTEFDVSNDRGIAHAPMSYFRFNCTVTIREDCAGVSLNRCGAITQNLSADDKNDCILPTYDFSTVVVQDATTAQQQSDLLDWLCYTPPAVFANNYSMSFSLNEYLEMLYDTALDFERTDSFSGSMRFEYNSATIPVYFFQKMSFQGAYTGWIFRYDASTNALTFILRNTVLTNELIVYATPAFVLGSSYHVAFTYNGSSDQSGVGIYVDGIPLTIVPVKNLLSATIKVTLPLRIGLWGATYSTAVLNVGRVWNVELSPANIISDYNGGDPDFPILDTNLVLECNFGDGGLFGSNAWVLPSGLTIEKGLQAINTDYSNRVTAI